MSNKNTEKKVNKKWRWYHGVAFYAGIQIATFGLAAIVKNIRGNDKSIEEFYNNQIQPIFAPPDWAFGPAWTINNVLTIWGLLRVLNMPKETAGRDAFLALQTATWLNFVIYSAASFSLRSNINGAVLTNLYFAFTLASLYVALARLKDTKTALSLSTLTVWLALASPLSLALAAWNGDEFYGIKPLTEPAPEWIKNK
jgi:tryptophan-rich sensory protein